MVTALAAFRDGDDRMRRARRRRAGEPGAGDDRRRRPTALDGRRRTSSRAVVIWDGALVWAAGSERAAHAIDDYDWEALGGGGFAALDPIDGRVVVRGRFPDDLAWGNGGVAVCPGARRAVRHRTPGQAAHLRHARRHAAQRRRAAIADASLGIAHAAAVGDQVLYGFNRGGYRLHATRGPSRTA